MLRLQVGHGDPSSREHGGRLQDALERAMESSFDAQSLVETLTASLRPVDDFTLLPGAQRSSSSLTLKNVVLTLDGEVSRTRGAGSLGVCARASA